MRACWELASLWSCVRLPGFRILLVTNVGLDVSSRSFFSSFTNRTSTLLRMFSMVLPNTLSFISLKKSFSNTFFASALFCVLNSMYCFSHGDWLNLSTLWTFLIFRQRGGRLVVNWKTCRTCWIIFSPHLKYEVVALIFYVKQIFEKKGGLDLNIMVAESGFEPE